MVTLYEFNQLNNKERASLVFTEGLFITNVILDDVGHNLYSLYGYYVELVLIETDIKEVTPFKHGDRLNKYLHQIDVAKLLWKT